MIKDPPTPQKKDANALWKNQNNPPKLEWADNAYICMKFFPKTIKKNIPSTVHKL